MIVPDLIEPFVAWRVWDVTLTGDGLALESLFHSAHWTPGHVLKATCRFGCDEVPADVDSLKHAELNYWNIPVNSMPCGIYAGKSLEQAVTYLPSCFRDPAAVTMKRARAVIGKVALSGLVKEHEKGYRAEYAKPVALWVPVSFGFPVDTWEGDPERAARLLRDAYDIPVKLFRRVRELEDQ